MRATYTVYVAGHHAYTPIVPRALLASIIEEPFIYILGGTTATGPTGSTERTVW